MLRLGVSVRESLAEHRAADYAIDQQRMRAEKWTTGVAFSGARPERERRRRRHPVDTARQNESSLGAPRFCIHRPPRVSRRRPERDA